MLDTKLLEDNVKFVFNQHQGHHFCFKSHIEATQNNKGSHETTPIYLCIRQHTLFFFVFKMHPNESNLLMVKGMHLVSFEYTTYMIKIDY